MKAIYLCDNPEKLNHVYYNFIDKYKLNEILSNHIFTKKEIVDNSNKFIDTNFIFSTWNMPIFTKEEIKLLFPNLKAIFYAAGTVKYFAIPFLENNVRVFSANLANAIPVAEYTVSQIILANKGYYQAMKEYKKPFWKISFDKARQYSYAHLGNYNAKIGIIRRRLSWKESN